MYFSFSILGLKQNRNVSACLPEIELHLNYFIVYFVEYTHSKNSDHSENLFKKPVQVIK